MSAYMLSESWTAIAREELVLAELCQAGLLLSEIASRLDRDERFVQQRINECQLQPILWTLKEDDLLQSLWLQEVKAKDIGHQLHHLRSETAVCIRASQLGLERRDFQKKGVECDGTSYMAGHWTSTGDAYVLSGVAAGLSDDDIWDKYFCNTRSVQAVASRRRALQKPRPSASSNPNSSGNAMATQPNQILQPGQMVRPSQMIGDVYGQMMAFHTTLSPDKVNRILDLIDHLHWPANVQGEGEIGQGSWAGLESAWAEADNKLLVALHGGFDLSWKEIADTFFLDRLEEELERQYVMLQAGGDADNSIELE